MAIQRKDVRILSRIAVWREKYRLKYGKDKSPVMGLLFTLPSVVMMAVLIFIPMGYQLYLSLFDTSLKNPEPVFIFLDGYVKMFKDPVTAKVLTNAVVWTIGVVALQSLVGLWAALTLNQKFIGRTILRGFVILPWVIPGTVAAMIWRLVFDAQLGFLNTGLRAIGLLNEAVDWLGSPQLAMGAAIMVAVWKGFGFSALMYMAGLQGIPKELYEAAAMDGTSKIQRFRYITLPSMKNIITTTLILTTIWTFNYFEIIYVLTKGGPLNTTMIPPVHIYDLVFKNFNLGASACFAIISFIMVGAVTMLYIRNTKKRGNF